MSSIPLYQHVVALGKREVENILDGHITVMPKLDGTNGGVYMKNGQIQPFSRTKEVKIGDDNMGFAAHVMQNDGIKRYLEKYPTRVLYGEWMPKPRTNSLTYDASITPAFWVFDVFDTANHLYMSYMRYSMELMMDYDLRVVPMLDQLHGSRLTLEYIARLCKAATFGMPKVNGVIEPGEGIVIKRYDAEYAASNEKITWAKVVSRRPDSVVAGTKIPVIRTVSEELQSVILEFVTAEEVSKEAGKLTQGEEWDKKLIPHLLTEITMAIIQDNPEVPVADQKAFRQVVMNRIKQVKPELFI